MEGKGRKVEGDKYMDQAGEPHILRIGGMVSIMGGEAVTAED